MALTYEEYKEKQIKETLDFHGVTDWHKLGYKGKGKKVLLLEDINSTSGHGKKVIDRIKLGLPEADIDWIAPQFGLDNDVIYNFKANNDDITIEDLETFEVYTDYYDIITVSKGTNYGTQLDEIFKKKICITSAGNTYGEGITNAFKGYGLQITSIRLTSNNEIVGNSYNAEDERIDFAFLTFDLNGTSFSNPATVILTGQIMEKYKNIDFDNKKMIEVLASISIDAGEKGKDKNYGYGVPVLPKSGKIKLLEDSLIEEPQVEEGEKEMDKDNLVIVLDPGHRRDTPGKRSNGFLEWEFNDEVVKKTYKLLKDNGYNVEITLDSIIHPFDETTLYGKNKNLDFRATSTNYLKTNDNHVIFISVHANAHSDPNVRGYEIFTAYGEQDRNSELLATCMLSKAIQYLGVGTKIPNRGSKDADFYVLKNTITPAILIEHDFFTNKEAREEMSTEEYKYKASIAIMEGIKLYVDKKNNTEGTTLDVTKENVNGNELHYIVGDTPRNSYYGQSEQNGNIRYIDASPLNIMFGIGDTTVKETGKYGSNGTFSWGKAVNGIMKFGDIILGGFSSRYWSPDGKHYPQSVLCYYRDGTFGVEKIKTASEISKPVWWAVGGVGLISQYGFNPDSEGFKRVWSLEEEKFIDYSDVLRFTDHMSIGVDHKDRVFLIRSWQVYRKTTIEHGKLLNLKYMIGMDSGKSTQMVTPEWSRPSEYYEKNVEPTRKVYNKILVKDL